VFKIHTAETDAEITRCFPLMFQLRPHLIEHEFVSRIRRQQREAGYQLIFLEEDLSIRCLAGYRISECLYSGKSLYVDDLVTDAEHISRGYGSKLFDWVVEHATENNCAYVTLDSGVQRFGAHRFYLGKGMDITCHHFALKLR
jgi:GNAT superfamily N-acetyltransferase